MAVEYGRLSTNRGSPGFPNRSRGVHAQWRVVCPECIARDCGVASWRLDRNGFHFVELEAMLPKPKAACSQCGEFSPVGKLLGAESRRRVEGQDDIKDAMKQGFDGILSRLLSLLTGGHIRRGMV